jgi:hypothetical protein
VFAIADERGAVLLVDITPCDPADFILPHAGRDNEPYDAAHRNRQAEVSIEVLEKPVQLILVGSPSSLSTLADKAQSLQREASLIDGFDRCREAMDSSGMQQNSPDISNIDPQGDWSGTVQSTSLSELDQGIPS